MASKSLMSVLKIDANGLRIYEVRQTINLNYKQMLVGVSCIYAVISCKNYGHDWRFNFMD